MMNNNIDYDTFVRNPPNPVDLDNIFNDPLSDTLFSNTSFNSPIPNSFNISSFNVNGLKTPGQGYFKIAQISSFFAQKHISFGGIVDKVACLNLFKILRLVSPKFYYRFIIVSAEFRQFRHL
ncbi:unnamed protein product [Rhizophagus irregularis]|nr:unnamed protein product [Rhizophagus irregularis]